MYHGILYLTIMLMEGEPRVVASWELQLSTDITQPLPWATCHTRPRGGEDEAEINPCPKADAQHILDTVARV